MFFAASWEASTSFVLTLNLRLVVNHCRRHDHDHKEEIDRDQDPCEDSEGSNWHNGAHGVSKEGDCGGARSDSHGPDSSSERVSHSLPQVALNDLLADVLALLPRIVENEHVVGSDSDDQEDGDDLEGAEVADSADALHNDSGEREAEEDDADSDDGEELGAQVEREPEEDEEQGAENEQHVNVQQDEYLV